MLFAVNFGYLLQHESAHIAIYEDYGIESKMHYTFNPGVPAYVQATNATHYFRNCNETCRMLQTQNEIVGYNVITLVGTIFFLFYLYVMFKHIDEVVA